MQTEVLAHKAENLKRVIKTIIILCLAKIESPLLYQLMSSKRVLSIILLQLAIPNSNMMMKLI